MAIIAWLLTGLGVYGLIGAVFAPWFVIGGVGRISPAARGTGWAFRVLIFPGAVAFWPVLLWEFVVSRGQGGIVIGRAARPDDLETAMDCDITEDPSQSKRAEIDPDAETSA